MRIARLELYGFKSFPDRTKFEFGHGVSVVVGPNGSGKSNVVDAMRWCIGEQSARSLRGSEMLDVIFAGSASRAPVGFAEVKLSLTADHGEPFPGEYALMEEVQVGRRLHRNGTSEYLLNGVKCRRRDIVDLFMDTGVGNNSYSFIAQGQVNKMVLASAMERRSIIDEAAGISKYTTRRAEAQQRLEATGTQLDRAADVADEMGRRLKVLERQVLKAARFRRFRALIRQEEIYLALVRYRELAADRRALRERLRATQGEAAGNRRELARRQNDLDSRREELQVVEAAASQWRDEVAEHDARARELEGAKGFQEQRRKEFTAQADRVEGEAKLASESLERERADAERSSLLAAEVQLEMDGAVQRGSDLGEAVRNTADARRSARASVDRSEAEANKARSARAIIQAKLGSAEAARDRLPAERGVAQQAVLRSELDHANRVRTHEEAERAVEVQQKDVVVRIAEVEQVGVALIESQTHQRVVALTVRDAENEVDQGGQQVDQDVEDAARAAEQKRVEAERTLAQAEREAAGGLREAREDASGIQDEARDEAAQAVADAEERAGQWRRAADAANREARNALEAEIAEEERQLAAAVEVFQAHVDEATALEGKLRGARTELASLEALVPDGLTGIEDSRALVDRLALQGEEAADWARRVGDRLLLPVVTKAAEIAAVADGLNDGQEAKLLLAGDGDPRTAWSKAWAQTGDLQAAVAHFLATGTGALAPEVRIDSDGVVHLGDPVAAVDALAIRDKISALRSQIDVDSAALGDCKGRLEAGRASLEQRFGAPHPQNARRAVQKRAGQRRGALKSEHDASQRQLQRQEEEAIREARVLHRKHADQRVSEVRQRLSVVEDQAKTVLDQVRRTLATAARAVTEVRALAREKGDARMLELRDVLNARRAAHVESQRATSQRQRDREQAQRRVSDAQLAVSKAQSNAALRKAAVEDAQQATLRACEVVTRIEQQQREKAAEVKVLIEEVDRADAVLAETERAVAVQRTALSEAESEERQAAQEASAEGAMANARQERLRSATQQVSQARGRAAEAVQRRDRAKAQAQELHADAKQAEADRSKAEVDLAEVAEIRAKSWDRLQRERERATKLREGLKVAEATLRDLQRAAEKFTLDIAKQEETSQKVRVDLEVLRRRMEERYQVSLSGLLDRVHAGSVVLSPDEAVAKSFEANGIVVEAVEPVALTWNMLDDADRIANVVESNAEHRKRLASLGEVNLGALEEYADLGTRFEELSSQRADLEASVADIRRAIAKMNKTCRQRFRDAFDRVNENFNEIYPRLVGGGSARLALTDEEDLLQTGVEIFVQPPGKRLQNLSLLSGGEKAMTAIALLISLFKVKPSPFCVLDEVDAPLDEANGARFNDIIKEMSSLTQFIVITHNRKTMEVADTLYGVTMANPGVSRLVSVNL